MKILPRFLYHFTRKENLQKILKQGIKATENIWDDSVHGANVYMVDAQNLAKNWTAITNAGYNLHSCLIFGQALKDGARELCCFRVPTKNLVSPIWVRSQKYCLNKESILSGEDILSKSSKYKLYQRNGHAIEYIHNGDIPPSAIELVGTARVPKDLEDWLEIPQENLNEAATSILKTIFQNSKEAKAFMAKV